VPKSVSSTVALASRTQASAGTKETNRNKIPEISDAPLTEQTIVVVALFPFAGRGWMQKKPFERVFQTLRASFCRFRLGLVIRLFILLLVGGLILVVDYEWDFLVGSSALQSTNDAYLQADTTPLAAKVPGATAIPDNYYNWLG
jgi:hypothetical protein